MALMRALIPAMPGRSARASADAHATAAGLQRAGQTLSPTQTPADAARPHLPRRRSLKQSHPGAGGRPRPRSHRQRLPMPLPRARAQQSCDARSSVNRSARPALGRRPGRRATMLEPWHHAWAAFGRAAPEDQSGVGGWDKQLPFGGQVGQQRRQRCRRTDRVLVRQAAALQHGRRRGRGCGRCGDCRRRVHP